MPKFLKLTPETFGLDISDASIRIVKLEKKGNHFALSSYGEAELKSGIIRRGRIRDEEALSLSIKEAVSNVSGEKLKTKYVVASLPEEKSFIQVIEMPKMREEELKSAVIFESENYIPLPIQDVYLDFQVIPSLTPENHFDILIAAMPKEIVDAYVSSLKKAGLFPLALEIESLAIARALMKGNETETLLIDLGEIRTCFVIYSNNSIRFTSSIPMSSEDFIKAARRKENISESLMPILADLVSEIKKHLNYYESHEFYEHLKERKIKKIVLCGEGVNLRGLAEFLKKGLEIDVVAGNPFLSLMNSKEKKVLNMSISKSLGYTTAFGLSMYSFKINER